MTELYLDKLDDHPEGAVHFFKFMMRFEYALKASGFLEHSGEGCPAVPAWDRYAAKLGRPFFEEVSANALAPTMLAYPPSKQTVSDGGELTFEAIPPPRDAIQLLIAVRRARNNLFHGGKSGDADHERNDLLVAEALAVLTAALMRDSSLREAFEGLH